MVDLYIKHHMLECLRPPNQKKEVRLTIRKMKRNKMKKEAETCHKFVISKTQ